MILFIPDGTPPLKLLKPFLHSGLPLPLSPNGIPASIRYNIVLLFTENLVFTSEQHPVYNNFT